MKIKWFWDPYDIVCLPDIDVLKRSKNKYKVQFFNWERNEISEEVREMKGISGRVRKDGINKWCQYHGQ